MTPRPGLVEPVPRQQMLRIADSYFDSIEQTNARVAPFAADCARHENGVQTTTTKTPQPGADAATAAINALNCGDQIDTRNLSYITRIRPRRLLIADEEYGLVFGFPMFVHRGDVRQPITTTIDSLIRIRHLHCSRFYCAARNVRASRLLPSGISSIGT